LPRRGSKPSESRTLLAWNARDGLDTAAHFVITEKGVMRQTGKSLNVAKGLAKGLAWGVFLTGIASGRSGSSAYGPTSHWLSAKSGDKQFMRWKNVHSVDADEEGRTIKLHDKQGTELRLCCTPDMFEPALRLIKERTQDSGSSDAPIKPPGPAATVEATKFCMSCGAKLRSGVSFCGQCGSSVQLP